MVAENDRRLSLRRPVLTVRHADYLTGWLEVLREDAGGRRLGILRKLAAESVLR